MDCVQGVAIASSILFLFFALMALNSFLVTNFVDEEVCGDVHGRLGYGKEKM